MFQQLLTEALLLAGAGGALGLLLAYGTLTSASTLLAGQVPRAEEISIDGRVLLFAVGVSMLTGMLAGTLPARARRPVRPQRRAQGRWAQRRCDRCRHAPRADRVRGRAVAGVVDGRRRDDPEPAGSQARRHRLRSEQRADDARETGRRTVPDAGAAVGILRRGVAAHSRTARRRGCGNDRRPAVRRRILTDSRARGIRASARPGGRAGSADQPRLPARHGDSGAAWTRRRRQRCGGAARQSGRREAVLGSRRSDRTPRQLPALVEDAASSGGRNRGRRQAAEPH